MHSIQSQLIYPKQILCYTCVIQRLFECFFALLPWNDLGIFCLNFFLLRVKRYILSLTQPNSIKVPQLMVLELRLLLISFDTTPLIPPEFPCLGWWSGFFSAAANPGWERGAGRGLMLNQLQSKWTIQTTNLKRCSHNSSSPCYILSQQLTDALSFYTSGIQHRKLETRLLIRSVKYSKHQN